MSLEDEVKLLLKDHAKSRKIWPRCPQDVEIAGYVDGTVDAPTRQILERHFSDCARCLDEVSFLVSADEWPAAENAPPWLIKKVEKLIAPPRKKAFSLDWRWATATVAVSVVVLVVVLFSVRVRSPNPIKDQAGISSPQPNSSTAIQSTKSPESRTDVIIAQSSPVIKPPAQEHEPRVPITRNSEATKGLPQLLSPGDGSVVTPGALTCHWQKVPDAAFYEVSIMTASGDVVVSRQTEEDSLHFPDLPVQPGAKYFISVRAHLRDGRTIRSSVVSFRVTD